jgi:hypothetical protein
MQFLSLVLHKLWELAGGDHGRFSRFTINWRTIEPYGVVGLTITALGVKGSARVLAVSVSPRNVKSYKKFAAGGTPHYELIIDTGSTTQWISAPDRVLLSTDAAAIAAALYEWCDAVPLPPPARGPAAPLAESDLGPLRALAAARAALAATAATVEPGNTPALWQALNLAFGFDPAQLPIAISSESRAALAADLAHLDPLAVASNMPRDDKGRLELGVNALLARYESAAPRSRDANMPWLAARAPLKRGDAQVVTLSLIEHTGKTNPHLWDLAPWLWDRRAAQTGTEQRWGISCLDPSRLGLTTRAAELAALEVRHANGALSAPERGAYCLLLQDEGRLLEALALFGVELSDDMRSLLEGDWLRFMSEKQKQSWPDALRTLLRLSAPWRFKATLEAELAARIARGVKKPRPIKLRIAALPHQAYISKYSLMLVGSGPDGLTPRLEGEATGWDARLADVLWRRPLELDLLRFGLSKPR